MKHQNLSAILTSTIAALCLICGFILMVSETRASVLVIRRNVEFSVPRGWILSGEAGEILGTARNPRIAADSMVVILLRNSADDLTGLADNRAANRHRQDPGYRLYPKTAVSGEGFYTVEYSLIREDSHGTPLVIMGRESYRKIDDNQVAVIAVESSRERFQSFPDAFIERLSGVR